MADDQTGSGRKIGIAIAGALAAGLVAGIGVLYVGGAYEGNVETAASCPANDALADALAANAEGEVAAMQPVAEPFDMSSVSFTDADGGERTIGDFAGRTLLVNLWATWCAPCRAEMPALDELEREKGGEDFAVVPINVDTGDDVKPKAFYEEIGLTDLPFFHDETMGVFQDLKSQGTAFGLPVTILVGKDGCARASMNGPAEWASPDAARLIDTLREYPDAGV